MAAVVQLFFYKHRESVLSMCRKAHPPRISACFAAEIRLRTEAGKKYAALFCMRKKTHGAARSLHVLDEMPHEGVPDTPGTIKHFQAVPNIQPKGDRSLWAILRGRIFQKGQKMPLSRTCQLEELKVGQNLKVGPYDVTAVPGGWIFCGVLSNSGKSYETRPVAVFVPNPKNGINLMLDAIKTGIFKKAYKDAMEGVNP